ncbi:unnamed protein product [Rotaria sordida]|uniref:Uncharacterized protein n=1 Tax=Rotaria sordida TaxID=392033 RepID=A0A819CYE2_9BILA|nr:unnamed protein product [Rotaria sordida]CAF3828925.1 unnamed protein product [Rotaria sordida]
MAKKERNKTVDYENGDVYKGEIDEHGRPHGKGTYIHHDIAGQVQQGCYVGEWQHDKKHGKGRHRYRNGDIYDGLWRDGPYKNDKKNGKGILIYSNGDKYEGMFKDGKRHGTGKYTFKNGEIKEENYMDDWSDNETVSAKQTTETTSSQYDQLNDNQSNSAEQLAD